MGRGVSRTMLYLLWHYAVGAGAVGAGADAAALAAASADAKGIGIYTSRAGAQAAIARVRGQPGFRDWPDGFRILEYWLDEDAFPDGFASDDT